MIPKKTTVPADLGDQGIVRAGVDLIWLHVDCCLELASILTRNFESPCVVHQSGIDGVTQLAVVCKGAASFERQSELAVILEAAHSPSKVWYRSFIATMRFSMYSPSSRCCSGSFSSSSSLSSTLTVEMHMFADVMPVVEVMDGPVSRVLALGKSWLARTGIRDNDGRYLLGGALVACLLVQLSLASLRSILFSIDETSRQLHADGIDRWPAAMGRARQVMTRRIRSAVADQERPTCTAGLEQ